MISVVIPLYNKEATICRTIQSVLCQKVDDIEIVIVDDGSTDKSADKVSEIKDSRIRCVRQDNMGVSSARNRGINEAKGEWIAFLDADDEWNRDYLSTISHMMDKYPECKVLASSYLEKGATGKSKEIVLNNVSNHDNDFLMTNYFQVAATSDPPIHTSSIVVKNEAIKSIGGFPEGVHQGEDLLTWARLAAIYKIAYCRTPLNIFHTGETSSMEIPKRIPAPDDPVGKALEELYHQQPDLTGLKQYIAHWHKMRASIYLRLPQQSFNCRKEIRDSRHWHRNRKLILYFILTFIPYNIRMRMINTIK